MNNVEIPNSTENLKTTWSHLYEYILKQDGLLFLKIMNKQNQ